MLKVKVEGIKNLQKVLGAQSKKQKKALETAIKVEAYRHLVPELKNRLEKGAPSPTSKFKQLSFLARGLKILTNSRFRKDRRLIRLKPFVRYHTTIAPFAVKVGFVGPKVPEYIKDWAELQQKGFERPISEKLRRYIIRQGARRGKIEGGKTPFFLKKTTKIFKTPSSPIIEPFWNDVKKESARNIAKNFARKMRGERI